MDTEKLERIADYLHNCQMEAIDRQLRAIPLSDSKPYEEASQDWEDFFCAEVAIQKILGIWDVPIGECP